ncbi:hypothetical protein, partial [Pseudomonas aeruginosa]|uniref:hypothetical protein n=1 Tax=Pseudomonas aeruginosa TaxID=287 RepID=UPI0031B6F1FD
MLGKKRKIQTKQNGPQAVFHKIFSNILEKRRQLQMRFYAMLPAPRQGGEAKTVSCNPSHSLI